MNHGRRAMVWGCALLAAVPGLWPLGARSQPPVGQGTVQDRLPRSPKASTRTASDVSVAWTLPEVDELVEQALHRIVQQDRPGGLPVHAYPYRSFGREATQQAIDLFTGRPVRIAPNSLRDVSGWPIASAGDSLPCFPPSEAAATETLSGATPTGCAPTSAMWLALVRIERGEKPQEIRLWYATRFRTNAPGAVTSQAYSFSELWRRVRDRGRMAWRYDGFISVRPGILTAAR